MKEKDKDDRVVWRKKGLRREGKKKYKLKNS